MEVDFTVFSDGSCGRGKTDIGAWAAYVKGKVTSKLLYGASYPSTVSRCELIPIIEAVRWLRAQTKWRPGVTVHAYSDSEYTVKTLNGINDKNANHDLWAGMEVVTAGIEFKITYQERNSHTYMQLCDSVCSLLRKRVISQADALLGDGRNPELIVPDVELPRIEEDIAMNGALKAYENSTHS
jgi:ribonuclease HI